MQENEKVLVVKRAKGAALARDFDLAERLYKGLINEEPSNTEFLSALGNIYMQNGDDTRALPLFTKILEAEPNNFNALNSTGAIYRRLKRYDESIDVLNKAMANGADDTHVHYNIGFTYKEMGKYDEAIECFDHVIGTNPNDVLAYNHLASIYALRGNYDKAVSIYQRGLQVDSNHPILQYNLARSYASLHRYDDAFSAYETALRAKPGWREATYDYMNLLLHRNRTKDAVNLINRTLSLYPNDVNLKQQLGKIMLNQFDFDEAINTLESVHKIDGNNPASLAALADAYEKAERAAEAIPLMDKIESVNPDDEEIQKKFAHILLSAHELEKAGVKIKKMYDKDENDVQVLDLYGQYYICGKDENTAKRYFEKINSLDPKYDKYINEASERYRQIGWLDKAEKYASDYLHKHGDDAEAYLFLARIQEEMGKKESALDLYQSSLVYNPDNAFAKKSISRIYDEIEEKSAVEEKDDELIDVHEEISVNEEDPVEIHEEEIAPADSTDLSLFDSQLAEVSVDEGGFDFDDVFAADDVRGDKPIDDFTRLVSTSEPVDDILEGDFKNVYHETEDLFLDEDIGAIVSAKVKPKIIKKVQEDAEEPIFQKETDVYQPPVVQYKPPVNVPPQQTAPQAPDEPPPLSQVSDVPQPPSAYPNEFPAIRPSEYRIPHDDDLDKKLDDAVYKARSSADKATEAAEKAGQAAENMVEAANAAVADALDATVEAAKQALEEATDSATELSRLAAEEAVATARQVATEAAESAEAAADLAAEAARAAAEEAVSATIRVAEEAAEAAEKSAAYAAKLAAEAATMEAMQKMQQLMDSQKPEDAENAQKQIDPLLKSASRLLPGIIAMLEKNKNIEGHKEMLLLFNSVKKLADGLPPEQYRNFMSSKVRLQLEYIISKLSGRPGLIATIDALNVALIKEGGQGIICGQDDKSNSQGEKNITRLDLTESVIAHLGMLTMSLEDKDLAQALAEHADEVLQKLSC